MAKRFIDSELLKKSWFRKLQPKMKLSWIYSILNAHHSGIVCIDFDVLSFMIGEKVDKNDFVDNFGDRILPLKDDYFFITGFIYWQYSCDIKELNYNNRVHKSAIDMLRRFNLLDDPSMTHARPIDDAKDKDKEKDLYKYKEKEKDKDREKDKDSGVLKIQEIKKSLKQVTQKTI